MNQTQKPWAVAFWSVHPEELIAPDGTPLMSLDEVGGMMDDDLGQGAWAWVQANCPSYKIEYEYLPDPEMPCIVPWLVLSNEPEAWDFKLRFAGSQPHSWIESWDEPWTKRSRA